MTNKNRMRKWPSTSCRVDEEGGIVDEVVI